MGNRVQHALRAFTARDRKALRMAAETYRENPTFDTEVAIREVGVGEAVTSMLERKGIPGMVERTLIRPPSSQLGPISPAERGGIVGASDLGDKYTRTLDRQSAFEILTQRTKEAAEAAENAELNEADLDAAMREYTVRAALFGHPRRSLDRATDTQDPEGRQLWRSDGQGCGQGIERHNRAAHRARHPRRPVQGTLSTGPSGGCGLSQASNRTKAKRMPADTTTDAEIAAAERRSGLRTIRKVGPYLWPDDKPWVKRRVVIALACLVLAKIVNMLGPLLFGRAVDALSGQVSDLLLGGVGLTLAYGFARLMNVGFQQLRDGVFARVGQRALRMLAIETFTHIHRLSMRYHITRKTGGLSRIIERGVKGVDFLLRFMLFSVGPLILELLLVSVVLLWLLDVRYMVVVLITIAIYVAFTFKVTEWRVRLRREMNEQDTDANQKAIDSLLNFETVKYFGAEAREAARYDQSMEAYEGAAIKTATSLAMLNFGQSLIITAGLVIVMVMAALGVQGGTITVGDFVMVNAYMIQITMPLNFLGTVYREIRQSLVDMGEMFDLLEQPQEVSDKPDAPALKVSKGAVRFEEVKFGYDPARPILKGVSLDVRSGENVALVGPSGSGKSTIGRLLFRFNKSAGSAKVWGHDIDTDMRAARRAIGVVPQELSSTTRSATTSPMAARMPARPTSSRLPVRPRSTILSCRFPKAMTRWWANAGLNSRAARNSVWESRAHCSRTRRSSFWTRRHRRSIPRPKRRSRAR